eukprot:10455880-Alexandrium_andersonii.AAC.1
MKAKNTPQKQIISVGTQLFPTPEKCGQFMVDLATKFLAGEVSQDNMYAARDEGLVKLGIPVPKAVFKRPASATTEESNAKMAKINTPP